MIEILREYSDLILLVFTIAVGISTIVYAFLTAKLVNETRRMRKSQTDPEISISLVQNDNSIIFIDLLVENIGLGPAYNLEFKVIKDFQLPKRKLSEVGFIKNGINYFSPKQRMRLWIASFKEDKNLADKSIELEVTFTNSISEKFFRTFILNFSQFSSFTQLGTPPLQKIANKLEKIERDFHNISTGFSKLKINIFDAKDREEEQKEIEEHFKRFEEKQKSKKST